MIKKILVFNMLIGISTKHWFIISPYLYYLYYETNYFENKGCLAVIALFYLSECNLYEVC